jgi:hypothetical protein
MEAVVRKIAPDILGDGIEVPVIIPTASVGSDAEIEPIPFV